MHFRIRPLFVALTWIVGSLLNLPLSSDVSAQERIWIAPARKPKADSTWYAGAIRQVAGNVSALDAKLLHVTMVGDEAETLIAAKRVIWIESPKIPPKEAAAIKLFADGEYASALRPLIDAVGQRPPVWRQQWLSMLAANAAWRGTQPKISLELVGQLDARPMAPFMIAWLPIDWDGSVRVRGATEAAAERLSDNSPAVRLVAASWLIASPSRSDAERVLDKLSLDAQRPLVARMAEVIRWRSATPPEIQTQAPQWQTKVDSLPLVLQTGPLHTLVQRFDAAGLDQQAQKLKLSLELTPVFPTLKP